VDRLTAWPAVQDMLDLLVNQRYPASLFNVLDGINQVLSQHVVFDVVLNL
jgi:hypothetical protein